MKKCSNAAIDRSLFVVCSRQESQRLPGKVFKKYAGSTALSILLRRLAKVPIPVTVAVPTDEGHTYSEVVRLSGTDAHVTVGNPSSPLHRTAEVLGMLPFVEYVVRVTHDDILIDPQTVVDLIREVDRQDAGYGITPTIVEGAGVEVIHRSNLLYAADSIDAPVEYVSYYVKGKGTPRSGIVRMKPRKSIERPYRLTIDYPEDAQLMSIVLRHLGPDAVLDDIVAFLDRNPHLLRLNQTPTISIYTCVYNGERFIEQTLLSIISATAGNTEQIIVDDASDDLTVSKAVAFMRDAPYKLILNDRNKGLASSCNVALRNARGRYIMRVDADDLLSPFALTKMLEAIRRTNSAVVYAAYDVVDQFGNVISKNATPSRHHHAGCALMDRNMINEVRFTEGLKHWDSLDLYKRIAQRFPIAYINEPLWSYRTHDAQMSKPSRARAQEKRKIA